MESIPDPAASPPESHLEPERESSEDNEPVEMVEPVETVEPVRTSRDVLYESIGIQLVNAGVLSPAATFIDDVRRSAGFRVSPREVVTAIEQIANAGQPVSVETVVEIVAGARGNRSQRQQRHASEWRALGALLTLRGMDGSPEGQRGFIGTARNIAGKHANDALLLQIALAVAELGSALDAETIGKIGKRLALSAPDLSPEELTALVRTELRALGRERTARMSTSRNTRSSSASRRSPRNEAAAQMANPGTRRWRPGGRRRRTIRR